MLKSAPQCDGTWHRGWGRKENFRRQLGHEGDALANEIIILIKDTRKLSCPSARRGHSKKAMDYEPESWLSLDTE